MHGICLAHTRQRACAVTNNPFSPQSPALNKTKISKHAPSFFRVPGVYHPSKAPPSVRRTRSRATCPIPGVQPLTLIPSPVFFFAQPWAGGESITKMPKVAQNPGGGPRKGISPDAPLWFHDQMRAATDMSTSGMLPSQSYQSLAIGKMSILAPTTDDPEDQPVQAPGTFETDYECACARSREWESSQMRRALAVDLANLAPRRFRSL